jgi:hypothetical protein
MTEIGEYDGPHTKLLNHCYSLFLNYSQRIL